MKCAKCIHWEITTLECRNPKVYDLVYPDCDDGFVSISIKFKPEFGCAFFEGSPKMKESLDI